MTRLSPERPLRVLLADPPIQQEHYSYYHPTMGILYLLGALRREFPDGGIELKYLQGHTDLAGHLQAVADFAPDFYGLSFKTQVARNGYKTLTAVKERFPDLLVVAGGAHASAMPEEVMAQTPVDVCFVGECEQSLPLAIRAIHENRLDWAQIPGVFFRDKIGVVSTPVPPFVDNLDTLPRPAWDMADLHRFPGMPYRKNYPYAGVTVSRGCPYKCTFCSEPIWKIHGKPSFRARSPGDVVEEIEDLYGRGVREIRLWSEELNADPAWAQELLEKIAGLGHSDLFLTANIRGDRVPSTLAAAMQKANMWMVNMGIESASNRTLQGVQKQVSIEEIETACATLARHGVKVMGYFQFFLAWNEGDQLCWENQTDARKTLQWAAKMYSKGHLHYMGTTISTPRPKTPLWDLAEKHGLLKAEPTDPFPYLLEGMNLPGLKPLEIKRVMLEAYLLKLRIGLGSGHINLGLTPRYAYRVVRQMLRN